jgi:peptidyl-prolyl cis-trans isomerase B (cyclophilin B)
MKHHFIIFLLLGIQSFFFISCKKETVPQINDSEVVKEKPAISASTETATIQTKYGNIKIRLFKDVAPKHVESFVSLAKKGFFDGTTFHRVIPNFMIQGGDPLSKNPNQRSMHGTGGPGYTVPAEFSSLNHNRGIVSAARSQDPDSAGSQFFICVKESPFLDGKYSIFGEVLEGMEVVDKIVNEPRDANDNPLERIEMKVLLE